MLNITLLYCSNSFKIIVSYSSLCSSNTYSIVNKTTYYIIIPILCGTVYLMTFV